MKALILVAFTTLFTQLSATQDLLLPDRKVTLEMPCSDAHAVLAAAREHGLQVTISVAVPAGTIAVVSDGTSAAVILVHDDYACLLGAGKIIPTTKPQRFTPTI